MRHTKIFLFSLVATISVFAAILYSSCQKTATCSNVCLNGGSCENGNCRCPSGYFGVQCQYSQIVYKNNTFTTLSLTLGINRNRVTATGISVYTGTSNDTIIYLKSNQTVAYYGLAADTAVATTFTYGPFGPTGNKSKDVPFGETVTWDVVKTAFAKSGTVFVDYDVRPDYFFLQINNQNPAPIGSNNITYIDVNPGYIGVNDTIKNTPGKIPLHFFQPFTVVNDSTIHNVGYFGANTSSTVNSDATFFSVIDQTNDSVGAIASKPCSLQFNWDQVYLMYVP